MMRGTRPLHRTALGLSFAARPTAHRQTPGALLFAVHTPIKPSTPTPPKILPLLFRTQFSSKLPPAPSQRDVKLEKELAKQTLKAHPERVTTTSSIPGYVEGKNAPSDDTGPSKESELVSDLHTVKETLALNNVPREPYALGLAGTLPYLGTSCATLYLSWVLNTEVNQSTFLNSVLVSQETATAWLQALEPIQVGYGAVIISFLGAIHWGLEYAEKHPSLKRTRFRYAMGVAAPMLAWPTIFMPVHWALITQFLSFTGLYLADLRATTRGWMPGWYSNYRFVLTAIVGAAIFLSLVGRAKVGQGHNRLSTDDLRERFGLVDKEVSHDWEKEEEEERERNRKKKEEEAKKKEEEEKQKQQEEKKKSGDKEKKEASDEENKEKEKKKAA